MLATATRKTTEPTDFTRKGFSSKTILFNCDCHTFNDVETQLMKAIHCSISKAQAFAWEVHTKGSAVVYVGHKERCEAVAMVLEDIGLITKVSD